MGVPSVVDQGDAKYGEIVGEVQQSIVAHAMEKVVVLVIIDLPPEAVSEMQAVMQGSALKKDSCFVHGDCAKALEDTIALMKMFETNG